MSRLRGTAGRRWDWGLMFVLMAAIAGMPAAADDQPRASSAGDGQPRAGQPAAGEPAAGQPGVGGAARSVPILIGLPAKDARAALTNAGLTVRFQLGDPAPSRDKELTVYAVEPPTGTAISAGSTVQITVYSTMVAGSAGAVTTPPANGGNNAGGPGVGSRQPLPGQADSQIVVPSLVGLSSKEARAALVAAGLEPRFQLGVGPASEELQFTVYSQKPAAQARLARQGEVELFVHARFGAPTSLGDQLLQATAVPYLEQETQEINPRTGRLTLAVTDLSVPAGAIPLNVVRSLRETTGESGLLGAHWRLNWESRAVQAGSQAVVEEGEDRIAFTLDETTEQYVSSGGETLVFGAGRTVWTLSDGRTRAFDEQGRLIESDERNGNVVRLEYDDAGRLTRISGPYNAELRLTSDERGRLTRIAGSNGATVQYAYESAGAAPAVGEVSPSLYEYDPQGVLVRVTTPFLGATQLVYDDQGRVTQRRWSDGVEERYVYDDATQTTRYVDPQQNVTVLSWNEADRLEESTTLLGDKVAVRSDAEGRPLEITGPTGLTARFTYDDLGRPVTIENPVTGTTRLEYLGETRLATSIVGPGTQQSLEYDAQGNLVRVTDALDPSQNATLEYFADGQIARLTLGDGQERRFTYDDNGRLATVADAAGNLWRFEYDERGNLVRDTAPDGGVTTRTFDLNNRLASVTDPLGETTSYLREQNGAQRVITITDPRGRVTKSVYNARNRLVSVTDPDQRITRYDYDIAGRLVRVTDPAGKAYQYQYDARGNLVGEVSPEGQITRRTYDAAGRVTSVVDPAGNSTNFEYAPNGRISRLVDASGRPHIFTYDDSGRLSMAANTLGTTRYERSPAGQVTQVIPPHGQVQSVEYDSLGNVLRIQQAEELVVEYDYNALGLRAKERQPGRPEVAYRYDGLGRLVGLEREGHTVALENDGGHRPGAALDADGAATRLAYTPLGRLLAATDPQGLQSSAFDAANHLVSVSDESGQSTRFEYDATGRIAASPAPGAMDSTFTYDPLRNCVRSLDPATGLTRATYDPTGRLLSVTDASGQTAWLTDQTTADDAVPSPLDAILRQTTPCTPNAHCRPVCQPATFVCTSVCTGMTGVVGDGHGGWEPRRWLFPRFRRLYGGLPTGDVDVPVFDGGWGVSLDLSSELDVLGPPAGPQLSDLVNVLQATLGVTPADRNRALQALVTADNSAQARQLETAAAARRKAAADAAAAAAAAAERQRQAAIAAANQQRWNQQQHFHEDDDWGGSRRPPLRRSWDDHEHSHRPGWGDQGHSRPGTFGQGRGGFGGFGNDGGFGGGMGRGGLGGFGGGMGGGRTWGGGMSH